MATSKHRLVGVLLFLAIALFSPIWFPVGWLLFHICFLDYGPPKNGSPFLEAHQRGINTFVNSAGFGARRMVKNTYWSDHSVIFEGTRYYANQFHLIGLTPEYGDRYFEGHMPKIEAIVKTPHRPPSAEEAEAIAKLRAGAPWAQLPAPPYRFYQGEKKQIRVIAPVFALESCLECHAVKTGTLLGAFDYWLADIFEKDTEAQADKSE